MRKGKGQQVMGHNSFPLEFQLPDGKDTLQTAQKCHQLKIQRQRFPHKSMETLEKIPYNVIERSNQ